MKSYVIAATAFLSVVNIQVALSSEFEMKGLKWGMSAEEIAAIAGGSTTLGCRTAIPDDRTNGVEWTYGGLDSWDADCVGEGFIDKKSNDEIICPASAPMELIRVIA
jgi:hypothetical protein